MGSRAVLAVRIDISGCGDPQTRIQKRVARCEAEAGSGKLEAGSGRREAGLPAPSGLRPRAMKIVIAACVPHSDVGEQISRVADGDLLQPGIRNQRPMSARAKPSQRSCCSVRSHSCVCESASVMTSEPPGLSARAISRIAAAGSSAWCRTMLPRTASTSACLERQRGRVPWPRLRTAGRRTATVTCASMPSEMSMPIDPSRRRRARARRETRCRFPRPPRPFRVRPARPQSTRAAPRRRRTPARMSSHCPATLSKYSRVESITGSSVVFVMMIRVLPSA